MRYLTLLNQASSNKFIVKVHEHGQVERQYVARAALNELMRPPFIPTAPLTKKEWSPEEIEAFYKQNPLFR